LFLDLFP